MTDIWLARTYSHACIVSAPDLERAEVYAKAALSEHLSNPTILTLEIVKLPLILEPS